MWLGAGGASTGPLFLALSIQQIRSRDTAAAAAAAANAAVAVMLRQTSESTRGDRRDGTVVGNPCCPWHHPFLTQHAHRKILYPHYDWASHGIDDKHTCWEARATTFYILTPSVGDLFIVPRPSSEGKSGTNAGKFG